MSLEKSKAKKKKKTPNFVVGHKQKRYLCVCAESEEQRVGALFDGEWTRGSRVT